MNKGGLLALLCWLMGMGTVLSFNDVQAILFSGSEEADTIIGSRAADVLTGQDGDDVLLGGATLVVGWPRSPGPWCSVRRTSPSSTCRNSPRTSLRTGRWPQPMLFLGRASWRCSAAPRPR